jgi:aspartate/methionine/tyrosine aminotransferase
MMKFERFELERIQSEWEHIVKYNLSESGVEALRVNDLITDSSLQHQFLDKKLGYPQTNGTIPLRELISSQYHDLSADHVTVTNGGAEANFITLLRLSQQRDNRNEMVMLIPNYMQLWGIGKALGYRLKPFYLQASETEWNPDIKGLKQQLSKKTHIIAICNPNNPTGATIDKDSLKAIAELAQDVNAWILSDEVYRGAELTGPITPSMLEFYDKTLVTCGLSKAYGLPGLRIGWVASLDKTFIYNLWTLTDYTTIAPSLLSDTLATIALQPQNHKKILARTRKILRTNWPIVKKWLTKHSHLINCIPPKASAVCLPKYHADIKSVDLAHRLIHDKSVLVPPGDHFQMPRHLRIGFGYNTNKLTTGLHLITETLQSITG